MVIDFHVHVGRLHREYPLEFARQMMEACGKRAEEITVDPARLLKDMDQAGIDTAVLLAFDSRRKLSVHVTNDMVGEWCRQAPQRLVGLASYDAQDALVKEELVRERKRYQLRGYKLAFGYLEVAPDDPGWRPLYDDAAEHGLPVLVHMGFSPIKRVSYRHCHPSRLEHVLKRYLTLTLVIAHMGWPWIEETIVLLARYPHVYADLSIVSSFQPVDQVVAILGKAAAAGVAHKLLFGTDYPMCGLSEGVDRIKQIKQRMSASASALPEEVWSMIMSGNAKRLLDLP
ncbi:MAG: amidohydrolase [Brevibacillus sp.]|nr:amidohydrolase [Brevibacillus sp.]